MRRLCAQSLFALASCAAALGAPTPGAEEMPADLILRHGKIVTLESERPEVQALAARDGRIVALGGDDEIERWRGPKTRVIELDGRLATPGLIESHGHFGGIGQAETILKLQGYESWDEIVAAVGAAAASAKPGEWIVGRGWHQEKWTSPPSPAVEGFPVHASLSAVSPRNPVALEHASGHATFANAAALSAAGIARGTPNPAGGEILRDANGEATGLLRESAADAVDVAYSASLAARGPDEAAATAARAFVLADREVLSKGITTFHDAGTSFDGLALLRDMAEHGRIGVRLWTMVRDSNQRLAAELARRRVVGAANGKFTLKAIKVSMDGALGSRGAWLLEPYADLPGATGLALVSKESLAETARLALANDYQLCVHAIGDRANREVLDTFEAAFGAGSGRSDRRWRIEHAQHLNLTDIGRFAKLGVIASMQGIHATSDAPFVIARLGAKRAEEGAYVWRKLVDSGAVVINGTDAPVEDVDPVANFYATVTRRRADGSTFFPEQRLTRMEALASYTKWPAWAGFEEADKGTLAPGKYADVTVLTRDILTVPEDEIPNARIAYTIVGGEVLYEAPKAP